jgi:hypothetical protein
MFNSLWTRDFAGELAFELALASLTVTWFFPFCNILANVFIAAP